MRGYLAADETELRELTDSAIAKLRGMSDAEYGLSLIHISPTARWSM